MSPLFTDQLDQERQKAFNKLESFSRNFVLAGGTAIMLQIGHRISLDFDCFCQNPFPKNLLRKVRETFGFQLKPLVLNSELMLLKTEKGIELHFVYYPYKPLKPLIKTGSINLFHLDDLAANKAYTIGRRGTWRDYLDLFFFLKWKFYTIEKIIALSEKKFPGEFHDKLFLEQLTYFDDLNIMPTTFLKESYTLDQIKSFLEKQVEAYVDKRLKV